MDIKYNKTIISLLFIAFLFMFLNSYSQKAKYIEKRNRLGLRITINKDTCFLNNDSLELLIELYKNNNNIWPVFVKKNMAVYSFCMDPEMIVIKIQHKGNRYKQFDQVYRNISNPKFIILKNRSYKRKYLINMRKLIITTQAKNYRYKQDIPLNKDFGDYFIQAIYYNPKTNAIFSNVVKVTYLNTKR